MWMTQQDDRILEYLAEESWTTPSIIESEPTIDISEGHIKERLLFLCYAGLVDRLHADMFEITGMGLRYLDGELDAAHRPWPTPGRALRG